MNSARPVIEGKLRIAGLLVMGGLSVEAISLQWAGPAAFLLFLLAGGSLMAAGILFYLYSLVADTAEGPSAAGGREPPE